MTKHPERCQEGWIQGELDAHRTNRLRVREGRNPPGRVNRDPPPEQQDRGRHHRGTPAPGPPGRAAREPGLCG
ncbi:hypothetical protein Slala03_82170 [Streptomyces lavendulae subsp. lavendulae]|nr:hypothetical protein Slala03_82170 [Streptomyces lavendulae subsp. lavendulae]